MATILCKVGNHHVHDDRRAAERGEIEVWECEEGILTSKYVEEQYNLNPSIKTVISDDFNLLNIKKP